MQLLIWFCWFSYVLLAKHYLFKTCEQNGFCHRNRVYGSNKLESNTTNYFIDRDLVLNSDYAIFDGFLTKKIGSKLVEFPFSVSVLQDGSLRFTIDEQRKSPRFKAADHVLPSDIPYLAAGEVKLTQDKASFSISFQSTKLVIYRDFKIETYIDNELQVSINRDKFLNIEHHRTREQNPLELLPEEIDFNMFSDNFVDSKHDTLPLGPESIGLDFHFIGYKNAFGIPEHSNSLNLKDEIYRLYNVDIFEYEIDSNLPMYGSIPFLLAMGTKLTVGLFWINSADTYIDIKKNDDVNAHWMSENGVVDFILFFDKTPAAVNEKYAQLTGYTSLPQLFALGYHQCRWNYNDEKDVLDITALFDQHQIPYDTIWLDIEYTDEKQYFTWNSNFPDPSRMLSELDHTGRNLVIIIDPHIKKGSEVAENLVKERLTIMNSDNDTFSGHCWPGESIWIDSFNPRSQQYWDYLHRLSQENKVFYDNPNIHLWNDMNEISVFDGPETSGPKDNLQYGDFELRSLHNLNGRKFHDMTYDSLVKRLEPTTRQRPFILTRSFFSGLQKTAAMWTGDNMSKWEYLKLSIPMVLNNGIAGMPFAGADVGGFFGNPSKDLLTRWYQTGIWYPFFRAHAHIDTRRREPWVPGEPYTSIIREAVRLRYSLLPEFYNAFRDSSVSGAPILKPIFYINQENPQNFNIEDEFFLGDSGILVKPVTDEVSDSTTIVFPDDEIYYQFTDGVVSSKSYTKQVTTPTTLNNIPMVLRGGSIISRKMRYRRSSKLMLNDPYTLVIAPNKMGLAKGSLYIDDYESFNYTNGEYLLVELSYDNGKLTSTVKNSFEVANKIEQLIILDTQASGSGLEYKEGNTIIKNPGLQISDNWELKLQLDIDHDEL